ncbi:MAG TPA: hypothetical protein VE954_37975 [Oligoflexus sp.]|uniref:hypothetical protein n=1 Tax=Oligoflexus sp. TaxID=1971216 RepID=UPI002D333B1E|nr:hypothetical protein [Oligoflexus sp.]HYX38930.1 hypothetical protein [Oligoflexus sp.]
MIVQHDIPAEEIALARQMALWFVQCGGEVYLEDLVLLCGAPEHLVKPLVRDLDPYYEEGGFASLDMLPSLWEALAGQSRVCLALHGALQALLKEGDPRAVQGVESQACILEMLRSRKT